MTTAKLVIMILVIAALLFLSMPDLSWAGYSRRASAARLDAANDFQSVRRPPNSLNLPLPTSTNNRTQHGR